MGVLGEEARVGDGATRGKGGRRGRWGTYLAAREAHGDDAEVLRLREEPRLLNVGLHGCCRRMREAGVLDETGTKERG